MRINFKDARISVFPRCTAKSRGGARPGTPQGDDWERTGVAKNCIVDQLLHSGANITARSWRDAASQRSTFHVDRKVTSR